MAGWGRTVAAALSYPTGRRQLRARRFAGRQAGDGGGVRSKCGNSFRIVCWTPRPARCPFCPHHRARGRIGGKCRAGLGNFAEIRARTRAYIAANSGWVCEPTRARAVESPLRYGVRIVRNVRHTRTRRQSVPRQQVPNGRAVPLATARRADASQVQCVRNRPDCHHASGLQIAHHGQHVGGEGIGTGTARAMMGTASEPKPAPKPLLLMPSNSTAGTATA